MTTRRTFLQGASIGAGVALLGGFGAVAFAADGRPALQVLAELSARLSPLGWRQLLLDATGGELDIDATDLASELSKPLGSIDRTYPGFGDFAAAGVRAVEPGKPEESLLYHALASPTVVALRDGTELGGFPTLGEIEAIENYVYAVEPPSLDALRAQADGKPLAVVVFALQYRNTPGSVHGRHAELCFARTGIARLGTIEPFYDARRRTFVSGDPERPFDFRVVPQRFAAYLAMQMSGDRGSFGPQDFEEGDKDLQFWVPIHKLFAGSDCIEGLDLNLTLASHLFNEKLKRFHQYLPVNGYLNQWRGEDLENFPFLIREKEGDVFRATQH